MKCKAHPMDHSSTVGVCASCLRQRLCVVMAAQAQAEARAQTRQPRKSEANLTPLLFPKSVSPYIPSRKSDTAPHWDHHDCHVNNYHSLQGHKFFSTPQIGPAGTIVDDHKKKRSNFSLLSNLFKFRTSKHGGGTKEGHEYGKTSRTDEHYHFESNAYSSEMWKQMPKVPAAPGKRSGGRASDPSRNNVSGVAFCLSPLVRVSPNGHWGVKGCMPEEVDVIGHVMVPDKPRHSGPSPFCRNGSRKLSDFGRHTGIH